MFTVDFHCHTIYSKDGLTGLEKLLETCRRKSLDRVVITDHNTIRGARLASQIDPGRVIIGEEIMTDRGELLAAFVSEEVPRGLSPQEAIARLRDQGAFISVSHPFDAMRNGHWRLDDLLAILPFIDAVEVLNARCLSASYNRQASAFAHEHGLPGTAGSDAHFAYEVGRAALRLPDFDDPAGLRAAIRQGQPVGGLSPGWVHFISTWAKWYKRFKKLP